MPKIYITRRIPESGINKLKEKGYDIAISEEDRVLSKEEIIQNAKGADALFCLLTDTIDAEVMDGIGKQLKIIANYAVGYNNIDVKSAQERGIAVTNTPGVLTETVAEHTFSLMLSIAHRIAEADRFTRAGKFKGWAPMLLLGNDLSKKTLGIIGLGRIGSRVAHHAVKGFDMNVIYHDINRNEDFEKEYTAEYVAHLDDLLQRADFISIHVPLIPETKHLINAERLKLMKKSAYLINTSRGPIVDEKALVEALQTKEIKGAALDVFENEPGLTPGLAELDNAVITPHTASATEETRGKMAELAAENIIAACEGNEPPNSVRPSA